MKNILILFFITLSTFKTFAQDPDKVLARVRYTYTNKTDTLKNGKTRTENMLLFIGKNASLYTSYDKIRFEISEDQKSQARALARLTTSNTPTVIRIDRSAGDWLTKTNYLSFAKEEKMIVKEDILGIGYLITETLPELKWKITKDTTTLSGVACQKAIANFDGKNWTVWFAPSLPFQSGPWKLQGLPGLILDAFDENKSIHFQFAGFEKANEGDFKRTTDIRTRPGAHPGDINNLDVIMSLEVADAYFENTIQLPRYRSTKTTRKEYDKLKAAYKKDPKGFSKAQFGF
ncbi:MAG: GLPGLI family protein [Bacteroidota bacterium]